MADLMVFAKGVTSGYLPLSGVMLTPRAVHEHVENCRGSVPAGFTHSGPPHRMRRRPAKPPDTEDHSPRSKERLRPAPTC